MAEQEIKDQNTEQENSQQLEKGTYEIIKNRLLKHGKELREKLDLLNDERKKVFGSIENTLLATERITTENNCTPADMVPVGQYFIFGYNVHIGLKTETDLSDVFSIYTYEDHKFKPNGLEILHNGTFLEDFKNLYKYYRETKFIKFAEIGPYLYMVFKISKSATDIKTFKWVVKQDKMEYLGNRFDHEFVFPDQHEFRWTRATRDDFVFGKHPHISIKNKVFVETTEGDLTIKVENNTDTGKGIYNESVDNAEQTLDDAEVYYSIIGNIILLKIKPYQEKKYRYIIFNSKIQEAVRVDALEDSCVLLPEDHGLIFANGYYLQTGSVKMFDNQMQNMLFERKIPSPHGEDYLFIFFNRETGTYILLSYNLIAQRVETPIICNGFSIFENGELIYFKSEGEQKKHHVVQIWKTPYMGADYELPTENDSYLFKVGNKDIVTAMAECNEVLILINKEDSYANLYMDIARYATDILDSFYWVSKEEAQNIAEPLNGIKESAESAIDEFEKVVKIRRNTLKQVEEVHGKIQDLVKEIKKHVSQSIDDYVRFLAELRSLRGETITLKELRYVNLKEVESFEKELSEHTDQQSEACVQFLLREDALAPYQQKVDEINSSVDTIEKVVDAEKLEEQIVTTSGELEMLIDIVSNLKIEDATLTTKIIDSISGIYAQFNQINAALKKEKKSLALVEGKAVFNSQIKLISQGLINYLDLSKTPEQCDEQMTKLMVQLEELEGKFAEFEDYVEQISTKREEIYNAFESKKVSLIERRNKLANNLLQSADRILKAIANRISRFSSINEINGYFASDLMIEKTRDIINELLNLGDSVKADDIQSRLKTVKEDAVRQLKDKTELFVEGSDVIKFGNFHFNTNTQTLSLSMVYRNNEMYYHLTGTNFFEKVINPEFLKTNDVWEQAVVSENSEVYRAEFLAYQALIAKETVGIFDADFELSVDEMQVLANDELSSYVTKFMGLRYDEGYVKGVHDHDATIILKKILELNTTADLLRFPSQARACAEIYWQVFAEEEIKTEFNSRLKGVGIILKAFPQTKEFEGIKKDIKSEIENFIQKTELFPRAIAWDAAIYLFCELNRGDNFVMDVEAAKLFQSFESFLKKKKLAKEYENSIASLKENPTSAYKLTRNWVKAFIATLSDSIATDYIDEVGVTAYLKSFHNKTKIEISLIAELSGLRGSHKLITDGNYMLNYNRFMIKLKQYEETTVTKYDSYTKLKKQLLNNFEQDLRLNEFKPRVLSSFVRNKLIDKVYLPLIGANLAKQIGAAGEGKRTDLMGLLLLISPPGYGKTTLMEYIASRLGIIFMKINGPAIGHAVTAIDPQEAPNAAAREELEKLNLAFEMGDNVMIYLDDIQHCNPEFLQKFISLCDAQRKIEGVYKGKSKTYDFRGKKVCVVMAGNPYTESGEKFKIPDMLANRADIYNLGDILGDAETEFKLSYIENCLTSNPVLNNLATKSQKDVHTIIKLAETGNKDGQEFEGNHSTEEINDYVNIIKKLLVIRDVVLAVNMQYIASAAQADEFRTEPPFKLQGSYRNMNKIAEKVMPVMNEKELQTLIYSHYENESQTLTTGAEANFLKFKELLNKFTEDELKRWEEIKEVFQRNQRLKGFGSGDKSGQTLIQLESISENLKGMKDALNDINKKVL